MKIRHVLAVGTVIAAFAALGASPASAALSVANCLEESEHIGIAHGATPALAQAGASAACVARGGSNACCQIYATFIKGHAGAKTLCLAGAQGANGDFGYGVGGSNASATSAALANCRDHASGDPKVCTQHGAIACQPNEYFVHHK
jgi:hypothetical protein